VCLLVVIRLGKLLETSTLSDPQLNDVRTLAENCNRYESLDYLRPNQEMTSHGQHFLFYEADKLAGFLTLLGMPEFEAHVIVDPQHRRKGIGRSLINAAKESCKRMRLREFLLISEEKSTSGKAFAEAIGAEYRYSEYRMKLERKPPKPSQDSIHLRRVDDRDLDLLVQLIAKSFNDPIEAHFDRMKQDIRSPIHRFYVANLAEEPVGCIGVVTPDQRAYVIAFGVLPEYRSRGYGRQMLTHTINGLVAENWKEVLIEVRTDNRNALSLYSSCGFVENTSYKYYAITS